MSEDSKMEVSQLRELTVKLSDISEEVKLLRRSLLGTYDHPGGYAARVVRLESDVEAISTQLVKISLQLGELKAWTDATKNRAVGMSIGLLTASAGIGGTIATIVSKILGP